MTDRREVILTDPEEEGIRIDRYISGKLSDLSRSFIQTLIREERILVNERPAKASYRTCPGDRISICLPDTSDPEACPENIPLDILFEDDELLVVNKPKGMVVHPAPGHSSGTLVNAVLYHCRGRLSGINGVIRPGIVHRIDKNTTGSLVVCKTDRAHASLADQLACHSITRRYRAIAIGGLREEAFTIEGNIGRDPRDRKKMALVQAPKGKPARTHVRLLQALRGYSYIECSLDTGRTHQIRVHMASQGHPLLGDDLYGPQKSPVKNLQGQTLHAMVLGFRHPVSGEYMEFTAPLPDYFLQLITKLT